MGLAMINLFYPLRCASCKRDLPYDAPSRICPLCLSSLDELPHDPRPSFIRSCFPYEGTAKELIHEFKYSGKDYLSEILVPFLLKTWRKYPEMASAEAVCSVPAHPARVRERGYNQSEVLAKEFAKTAALPYISALERVRNTPSQIALKRDERARNVEGAFRARAPALVRGKSVLLVDDVCTTGATLQACAAALREAGSGKVFALTFARQS